LVFIQDEHTAVLCVTNPINGAWILIDARIGRVGASAIASITQILCTVVAIRTIFRRVNTTVQRVAGVFRAGVGIVACQDVLTAFKRITCIGCTRILIITGINLANAITGFCVAGIERACVPIIATFGGECASQIRVTGFVGAQVVVGTV